MKAESREHRVTRIVALAAAITLPGCLPFPPYEPPAPPQTQPARLGGIESITVDGMPVLLGQVNADPRSLLFSEIVRVRIGYTSGGCVVFNIDGHAFAAITGLGVDLSDYDASLSFSYEITPPRLLGDVNGDDEFTETDLVRIAECFGTPPPSSDCWVCDLDRSGGVDEADLGRLK